MSVWIYYVLKYIFGVLGRQNVFFCVTFNIYPSNYFLSIDAANSNFTVRRVPQREDLKMSLNCSVNAVQNPTLIGAQD